jgi:periplasmic protein TonB
MQPKPPPPPISIARFILNDNPEIDLPELNIDAGVDANIPDKPWFPPALPDELPEPDDIPRLHAEVMPSFPGGEAAMHKFLRERLIYPQQAKAAGISGTVYLSFVVEKDGRITEIEVLRGGEAGLGQEAVRVVNLMPFWNPGIQAGRPVKVKLYNAHKVRVAILANKKLTSFETTYFRTRHCNTATLQHCNHTR